MFKVLHSFLQPLTTQIHALYMQVQIIFRYWSKYKSKHTNKPIHSLVSSLYSEELYWYYKLYSVG